MHFASRPAPHNRARVRTSAQILPEECRHSGLGPIVGGLANLVVTGASAHLKDVGEPSVGGSKDHPRPGRALRLVEDRHEPTLRVDRRDGVRTDGGAGDPLAMSEPARLLGGDLVDGELGSRCISQRQDSDCVRPVTLAQASRISGITPADVALVLAHLEGK